MTKSVKGENNPLRLKNGLLGKRSGSGAGKNSIPANPLGISGGLYKGKGIGVSGKKPNFINNPIGYIGGILRKKGSK